MRYSRYFDTESEPLLACPCGCGLEPDVNFMVHVTAARARAGIPFIVTSGARCARYNESIGGHPNSAHVAGRALDINRPQSREAMRTVMDALHKIGFAGIEVGTSHIHFDNKYRPAPVYWTGVSK